eukprot:5993615-Prymnesium_polylepis.1
MNAALASTALSPVPDASLRPRACRAQLMQAERASDWSVTLDRRVVEQVHKIMSRCQSPHYFRQVPTAAACCIVSVGTCDANAYDRQDARQPGTRGRVGALRGRHTATTY